MIDLEGQIERITYANEENGYTVARVKVGGQQDLITVVGNIISPKPGDTLNMQGEWVNHPKFGEQFKIAFYKTVVPSTAYGIRKYLGSGLIKGIGPVIAERIVDWFGENSLNIIENRIEDLMQVDGIGKKRIQMIKSAWSAQKEIQDVMIFLQSHGVSSAYAVKIFKAYGNEAIPLLKENPYRMATDIFGIGFVTADRIAEKLGFAKNSPLRAEAGILYVLQELSGEGHVYYPYEPLIEKSTQILQIDRNIITDAISRISAEKKIVIEDINESLDNYVANNKAVFLSHFYTCETRIARRLKILLTASKSIRSINTEKALNWVQNQLEITLAEKQRKAIQCALDNKILVITGGPGTGKTTIINAVLKIYEKIGVKILLAAPTGRAAKRMEEATGYEAKTIHRLLEYNFSGFQRNEDRQLNCDLIVIDEASMIDTVLMHHLLKAVPDGATLILVGDVNQLPSVAAGNVLGDIINSGIVKVVALNEIFRQAQQSQIIINAHRINNGFMPYLKSESNQSDFYFIEQEDPEEILKLIIKVVKERIPKRFGFDSVNDVQVLSPMHKGIVGAGNLNNRLQDALNPGQGGILRNQRTYRVNDKVMQIKNNYDKEVFNGDIGRIVRINFDDQEAVINFDRREITYDFADFDEIVLAYAVSVHKSQGSEYPAVIIPVVLQHYVLLQRNLIYTAVTRGKNLVVMIGTKKALAMAIKNDKTQNRFTRLRERLMEFKSEFSELRNFQN